MPRGIVQNEKRQLYIARACDSLVERKTKDREVPDVELNKHFVTMYIKVQTKHISEWKLHGYRCLHCDKIAATKPDLAKKHLIICTVLKKQKIQF